MTCFTVTITNDLDLDVTWLKDKFFHVHTVVTEGSSRFSSCTFPSSFKLTFGKYGTHTLTATTGGRLHHYGVANFFCGFTRMLERFKNTFRSWYTRYTSFFHGFLSRRFVPHFIYLLSRSTNKFDPVLCTNSREFSIFT